MKLTIKYVQDGEMNVNPLDHFLENVIIPIASAEDLVYTFEEHLDYGLVIFEELDLSNFTTCWLANSEWEDETIGVFQENLKELLGYKSEREQHDLCLSFWCLFNAIGAETYTWED